MNALLLTFLILGVVVVAFWISGPCEERERASRLRQLREERERAVRARGRK